MKNRLIILAPSNRMEFSGTPYALARALGDVADLPFELVHATLRSPAQFRAAQLAYAVKHGRWRAKNGFGLSYDYMSAAWAASGVDLRQGDVVIVCHPIAPRQVVAAARDGRVRIVNYIDMPLAQYFDNYDLKHRIPVPTRRRILAEEADSLRASWHIFVLDDEALRDFRRVFRQIEPGRFSSIGRGANVQSDELVAIRQRRRGRSANPRLEVLFVGKDAVRKGLYEAIDGIDRLPPPIQDKVLLHVVGPNEAEVPDRGFVKKYGLLNRDKSPELFNSLLARADLGLLLTKAEGNPSSIGECLVCGIPAIASALPRLTEIFHGAAVEFVALDDLATHFSALLARLVQEPAALSRLIALAERDQDRFTWKPVVERLVDRVRQEAGHADAC